MKLSIPMPGGGTGLTLFSKLVRTKDLRSVQGEDPRSTKPKLTVNPIFSIRRDLNALQIVIKTFNTKTVYGFCSFSISQKCLTTLDLTSLGVGSCCGTGMYLVAGMVARTIAGPGVVLSFLIAAIASIFSGNIHSEISNLEFISSGEIASESYKYVLPFISHRCLLCRIWRSCATYIRICIHVFVCVSW